MKRLQFICLLFFSFITYGQNALDSAWIRENYYKIERMIPMRDGVKLFTAIYIPRDTTEKHPILINRTPYSCKPYGESNFAEFWNSYQRLYLRENYILVFQDVRGRYMSEGTYEDVRPFNPEKKAIHLMKPVIRMTPLNGLQRIFHSITIAQVFLAFLIQGFTLPWQH